MSFAEGSLAHRMAHADLEAWCDPAASLEVIAHGFDAFDDGLMKAAGKGEVPPWAQTLLAEWWATETRFYRVGMMFGRLSDSVPRSPVHLRTMRLFRLCLHLLHGRLGPHNDAYEAFLSTLEAWFDGGSMSYGHMEMSQALGNFWKDLRARDGALDPLDEAWAWAQQAMFSAYESAGGYYMTFNQGGQLVAAALFCADHPSTRLHTEETHMRAVEEYKVKVLDLIRVAVPVCPLLDRATWSSAHALLEQGEVAVDGEFA